MADKGLIELGEGFSLALKNDGTVVAWGRNDDGQTNPFRRWKDL